MSSDSFHDEMAPYRPARPELGEGTALVVRNHANRQFRIELLNFFATSAGRKIIGRVGDMRPEFGEDESAWPQMFCAECYAGTYPEFAPVRGLDSHQECAEDGEPVFWTVALTPVEVWAHRVFNVLVDTCRASERIRQEFMVHFPGCREFRFQGGLGFGGKVCSQGGRTWVSCYVEDETPERISMVAAANARLAALGSQP